MTPTIDYGKVNVTVYRTYATPLRGITPIPESSFTGRENTLFAARVDVDVFGDSFLPAYTDGDNSNVVATDTMKNFVWAMALEYGGATLEGFAAFLGKRFLETWAQMGSLRVRCLELPFVAESAVLLRRSHDDASVAEVEVGRRDAVAVVTGSRSARVGLLLVKLTGSSFTRFVRDDFTTLPEVVDRPLSIALDVHWRYADLADALGDRPERYVAPEQVRDLLAHTFDEFNSRSIQHLVHEMGQRVLARFPQLAEVSFDAQNRLWDTAKVSDADAKVKVYTDPRATYGRIGLTLRR